MTSEPANVCAEMLLEYQGVVVHDLRGELNALLLTVDYLRRQLGTRPEVAALFGETLGDLDHVRISLNRTLHQLELVGQARKTVSKKKAAELAPQNLGDIVRDVIKQHVAARAQRRRISLPELPASELAVRVDPVLLHLAIQRLLYGMIELGRDTALGLEINGSLTSTAETGGTAAGVARPPNATLHVRFAQPQKLVTETLARLHAAETKEEKSMPLNALRLTARLAEMMGGTLRYDDRDSHIRLELPLVIEAASGGGGDEP